jgi:hypothetical protein
VPTPFYHLDLAQSVLMDDDLPTEIRKLLYSNKPAFFMGNIAPDVQVISGRQRIDTHFYQLPIHTNELKPWERLFQEYPDLANVAGLPTRKAVFLGGYCSHLLADWLWAIEVFEPVFGMDSAWRTFEERLYLHNVLRSHMDLQIYPRLNGTIYSALERAVFNHCLTFAEDQHLETWKKMLTGQLGPGGEIQTVNFFSNRQGISAAAFYDLLHSEESMELEIFTHLPRQHLDTFRKNLIRDNINLYQHLFRDLAPT